MDTKDILDENNNPKPTEEVLKYNEIKDSSLEDILAEQNRPTGEQVEQPKVETIEPEDEPTKPVTETTPPPPPAPQLDPEQLKTELKSEISQEVAQKVVESLTGEKKDQGEVYPWDKENRVPTYKEALDYVKTKAKEEIKAELEREVAEEDKKEQEVLVQQETEQKRVTEAWNQEWDRQLQELEAAGRIPRVVNPQDEKDQGRETRLQLFQTMQEVSSKRMEQGLPPIMNIKEVFYEHYKAPTAQPPGADAPIAGARRSVANSTNSGFSYADVKRASFEDILSGK